MSQPYSSPELAARRTAAAAVLADFQRDIQQVYDPHWMDWAYRLAESLRLLLEELDKK